MHSLIGNRGSHSVLKEEHIQGTARMLGGGTRLKKGRDRLETSGSEISGRLGDGLDGHSGSFAENRLDKSDFNGHIKRQLAGQRGAEQPSKGGLESPWEMSCSQERLP